MYKLLLKISLIWFSIYGTVSIFIDNMITRSIKEMLLGLLIIIGIVPIIKKKSISKFHFYNLSLILLICAISVISLLHYSAITTMFIYGFKITLLPLFAIFIGSYINKKDINITTSLAFIYLSIIAFWLYQNQLGLDNLLTQGYEYGVNVKHYVNGVLRLPSLVGTPDSYALLLSLLGIIIQSKLIENRKFKTAVIIGMITLLFIYLSTIRSALLMFLTYQFVLMSFLIFKAKTKQLKLLAISAYFFILASIPIALILFFSESSLASTSSIDERLDHWLSHLAPLSSINGWFGIGLGAVGAASRRLESLGLDSLNYAVDNQFLALYQQVGLVGLMLFIVLLLHFLVTVLKLIKFSEDNLKYICTFGIIMGVIVSCMFTNTLEVYPFNVIFYLFLGYILQDAIKGENSPEIIKLKHLTFK